MAEKALGDSAEQKEAEELLVAWLGSRLGAKLTKRRFALPDGGWMEVDGASDSPALLCEAWAHQGPPKSAQKNKVMADALKLLYARQLLSKPARLILLFADRDAAAHFLGRSWMAQAVREFGVEVHVAQLPSATREAIRRAQERQFR